MAITTYQQLAEAVHASGGLLVVDMGTMRDLEDAGKLGKYIRERISQALGAHGLGHFPEELPIYQHEVVRVYERATAIGRMVAAVLHPSSKGDETLRGLDDEGDTEDHERLEQIKRILAI